ncbi:hypothetical protein ACF0H5_017533 [Mactra antiquata]
MAARIGWLLLICIESEICYLLRIPLLFSLYILFIVSSTSSIKMLPKDSHKAKIVEKMSGYIPTFTDIFDEESFYIFVFFFVIATICVAVYLSKRIEIKDGGHLE